MLHGMPRAYSVDFRDRQLRADAAGLPAAEIARTLGVHPRSLQRWRTQLATTGSLAAKRPPGRPPKIPVSDHADLVTDVLAHADATLDAHRDRWKTSHDVEVSRATMSRLLRQLDLPLKKRP
jgi:transposase